MNNKHILDLTVRLSQALDQNYDVVNMDAVLSVISALEGATITKEQLEATRLAKYINQLRRRTKSEQLARRAKSLLKQWREMVVSQTIESASTSVQQQQLHHHRSHPTSPTVVSNIEHGVDGIGKAQSGDFLRSTASNPATTSPSTGSASIISSNNKRQASFGGVNLSVVPSPAVPPNSGGSKGIIQSTSKDVAKQPTSFANLLTGVVKCVSIDDLLTSPSSRKSNKRKDRFSAQSAVPTKTFVIDQSSSSNTELSRLSIQRNVLPLSNIASEIIDIQDSNSDSEINTSTPTPSTYALNPCSNIAPKVKKSKKEKKRKEREQQQKQNLIGTKSPSIQNMSNIIEESCSSQLRPTGEQEYDKFVPIADDRSRIVFPISGISEILSLSNSSMNSMFPSSTAAGSTVLTGSAAIEQSKTDLNVDSSSQVHAKSLLTSDLSFAGKFKSAGSSDLFSSCSNSNAAIASAFAKASSSSHPFVPFNSSGGNSNDSTSNSQTSQFDIDVVNQDNSQCKIIDELRQQHKKLTNDLMSTTTSILPQQPTQNKSIAAGSWSGQQVLLPPTSINNARTFNTNVVSTAPSCEIEQKIPKKRGRKKGSKGVDSVIAKETSLCSQMLMTTLGTKKVKTTKELYTEMQNRKLGVSSTTSSPTLSNWLTHQQLSHISRPNSSCSEPSLHSPRTSDACSTNATVSTVATRSTPDKHMCNNSIHGVLDEIDESYSDYNTSDPSRDSTTAQRQLRRRISTDSNSNSNIVSKINVFNSSPPPTLNSLSIESIEKEIAELLSQLPPVQSIEKIVWECNEDVVPCSCKVVEVETTAEDLSLVNETCVDEALHLTHTDDSKSKTESTDQQPLIPVIMNQPSTTSESHAKYIQNSTTEFPPEKPKKSIFDLDFEEDEDPLYQFVAEAAAKQEQKFESIESISNVNLEESSEIKIVDLSVLPPKTNIQTAATVDYSTELQPNIILPTFKVNEDPKCLAKDRYEIQTQKVTQFHVESLHNCYIPNVNGNWDNAETPSVNVSTFSKESTGSNNKLENILRSAKSYVDLWLNVVPQYGSLIDEYIPKDLSHVNFTSNFKPRKTTSFEKKQHYVPFLGVVQRRLKRKSTKNGISKSHVHENCHKVKVNSIHANNSIHSKDVDVVDSAINLNNESNDSDSNEYIKRLANVIINNKDLKSELGQHSEEDHEAGDNSNSLIDSDNLIGSVADEKKTQIIIANESNKILSGITIDIEDDNDVEDPQNISTAKNNDSVNSYLLTLAKLPEVLCYHSYENQNDQNINNNSAISSNIMMNAEEKSTSNTTSTLVKNVDSRRSSSCSNSSLKQTQHSINLKLRRQRLKQQNESKSSISDPKLYRKKGHKSIKLFDDETVIDRKPSLIKRIKIAINGDIATQRQISIGSSNNTTDEDDEEDDDCFNSVGSRSSPIDDAVDEYNIVNEDCEEEEYIDDEYEEDDEEDDDYAGDYHEVVTRDISATSTGNNHIVLTIKKTPSKTNSPSESLSAISPVIVSGLSVQSTVHHNLDASLTETKDEKALAVYIIDEVCTGKTQTACENFVASEVECDPEKNGLPTLCDSNTNQNVTKFQDIENKAEDPASLLFVSNKLIKRRLKRRRKKILESSLSSHGRQKLHRKLFFPHELQASDLRASILNISSCSSSCADGSEYEYESVTDSVDESKQTSRNFSFVDLPTSPNKKINASSSICSTRSTHSSDAFYTTSDSKSSYSDNEADGSSLSYTEELVKKEAFVDIDENIKTILIKSDTKYEIGAASEDTLNQIEDVRENVMNDKLSMENNGLLKSFNNIYITPEQIEQNQRMTADTLNIVDDEVEFAQNATNYVATDDLKQEQRQQQKLPLENCDVYNNFYNNNNNSKLDNSNNSLQQIVRTSSNNSGSNSENISDAASSSNHKINNDTQKAHNTVLSSSSSATGQLIPQKEYRTGLRAVDEDVDDDDGNNCARIQQFKEWYQVLQLRSYNDELLTVLPYVVLE